MKKGWLVFLVLLAAAALTLSGILREIFPGGEDFSGAGGLKWNRLR